MMKASPYTINAPMTVQLTYVNRLEISFGKIRRYKRTIEILVKTTTTW
jgi:hypothetical protein